MITTTSSACSTGPTSITVRAARRFSSNAASPAGNRLTTPSAISTPVIAARPKPRSLPTRSRKLKVIACTSPMQLMPTMPNQTAVGRRPTLAWSCPAATASATGKAASDTSEATPITPPKTMNSTGPLVAAISGGVAPRKTIPKTPSAMPTIANSRCGRSLRAIVPCVTLSAEPAASPATACSAAMLAKSLTIDTPKNARAAPANPSEATVRPCSL